VYSGGLNWRGFSPGSAQAFALATFLVVIASLMRWGIGLITEVQGFATYYPAVLFAALVGGAGVGIFAIVLGGVISWWAFLPPHFVFSPLTSGQAISLLSYLFASLLIVWAADHYRRLTKRLEDEENFRKLAV
jgi:K+-sensing histidine kinase KdpD